MTWFVAIAMVMVAGALAWVLPTLLRRASGDGVARLHANLAVLRDQARELDADLERGVLAREQYDVARAELERRVLEEAAAPEAGSGKATAGRWVAGLVGVLIPVAAALLYLQIGSPDALAPQDEGRPDGGVTQQQVEEMVGSLSKRLEANPNDLEGWMLLGRSYYVMGRFTDAVAAYEKAVALKADDARLYADYADALAMSQDRRFDARVLALVEKSLKADPDNAKALALAATAALERKDYRAAIPYLERLQRQAPPDSDMGRMVGAHLEEARAKAGEKGPSAAKAAPASAGATITGRVSLSPALAGKAAPADTVFILARATEGPRMPLAILKRQAKDLPFEFTLSDEQAMSPQMKLSGFKEVVVVVRVSKSGGAAPQSGDLQGQTSAIKVGSTGVNVTIESVVP